MSVGDTRHAKLAVMKWWGSGGPLDEWGEIKRISFLRGISSLQRTGSVFATQSSLCVRNLHFCSTMPARMKSHLSRITLNGNSPFKTFQQTAKRKSNSYRRSFGLVSPSSSRNRNSPSLQIAKKSLITSKRFEIKALSIYFLRLARCKIWTIGLLGFPIDWMFVKMNGKTFKLRIQSFWRYPWRCHVKTQKGASVHKTMSFDKQYVGVDTPTSASREPENREKEKRTVSDNFTLTYILRHSTSRLISTKFST